MKGICFTEPLFHKVVKGEKTQTRRIINPQPDERGLRTTNIMFENYHGKGFLPKYKVDEVVYLKEPYIYEYGREEKWYKYYYKFSTADILELKVIGVDIKWKNKLFMPESAARYFIETTAVRAERLQDISDEDCMKEGIDSFFNPLFSETRYKDYLNPNSECRSPQSSYASLINKINGKGTWEKNPWVWVYDFELINK